MASPDQGHQIRARTLLRRLADETWNTELHDALTDLYEDFSVWTDDEMSSFVLLDKIHEFHKGIARELYGRYMTLDPEVTVSRTVVPGLIEDETLGKELLQNLAVSIDSFREMRLT